MKFRMKRWGSSRSGVANANGAEAGAISNRGKKGRLTVGGRIFFGLFFGVFLVGGLGSAYSLALRPWMNVWMARTWVPVSCVILSSDVKRHSGSDSTTYSVAIAYAYDVEGQTYEGNRYDFTTGSSSGGGEKREIVKRYREGMETVCYVNPKNPAESVMERSRVRDWGLGLIPMVFVVIGAGGVASAIRGPRKKPAPEKEWPRERGTDAATFAGKAAPDADFADEGSRAGWVELTPGVSRVGGLIAVSLFALFWNGIVSVFLVNLLGEATRGGAILWVFVVFLLPFVAIGLFLIGLTVRMTMALTNPVPRLTVNKGAFAPGETVEVTWHFEGTRGRLTDLRLWLEGREEATYRRGTDTRTDKEVFATLEIAAVTGLASGEPGQGTVRLPERTMHSFKSDNNRVIWMLKVKGGIAWWPDLKEEFGFTIAPPRGNALAGFVRDEESSES